MTTAECVGVDFAAAGKENIVDGSNPIENCSWDDVAVTTTLTNAASRTKKGESLKVTNATRLQGFCINGELIPTASIVKDHLQRWAIRKNKPRARRLAKQPLCEAIVQWKGEHDRSVANGTVELINPSTNMPLRFNMKRFVNVMFGHIMLPQLAKRGRVLTAGDLEDGKRIDQDLFQNFWFSIMTVANLLTLTMRLHMWMILPTLLISLHSQPQNGKMQRGSLGS